MWTVTGNHSIKKIYFLKRSNLLSIDRLLCISLIDICSTLALPVMMVIKETLKQTRETCAVSVNPFLSFYYLYSGVPSAPRNVVSVVNQTSVLLEWHSPRDTGHRDDLSYNVLCRRCHSSERRACQPCDDSVVFVPGKRGLKETRVEISKLRAHTSYTFDIQVCPQTVDESGKRGWETVGRYSNKSKSLLAVNDL